MCNEYARHTALGPPKAESSRTTPLLPFRWFGGRIPNTLEGKASVHIRDPAPVFRLQQDKLVAEAVTWAWLTPNGKPVFNFVSENRDINAATAC